MAGKAKTEKMSVTIPIDLAQEIRSLSAPGEVSSFFTEAITHYLEYRKQTVALQKGFGAWKDTKHPELVTPEDTRDYVCALRKTDRKKQ